MVTALGPNRRYIPVGVISYDPFLLRNPERDGRRRRLVRIPQEREGQ
jgi:hypothetical protein